jgi:hypothetical protein
VFHSGITTASAGVQISRLRRRNAVLITRGVTQVVVEILAELLLASLATEIVVDTRVMMHVRSLVDQRNGSFSPHSVSAEGSE